LVRVGPARDRRARAKGPDQEWDGYVMPSEFEDNDEDLVHYLESNTSFLVNMNATGAFTAS